MPSPTLRWIAAEGGNRDYSLRPGVNTLGRHETNSLMIDHPSVSGSHCELVWEGATVTVRDLNSTNGTFIGGHPVQGGSIKTGQVLRLGSVELVLSSNGETVPQARPERASSPGDPPLARPMSLSPPAVAPVPSRSFLGSLPGAFVYPASKNGIVLVVAGAVVFGILGFLGGFPIILSGAIFVFITGYLFAYVQKIISASAQGETEMPDYPDFSEGWSDIVQPFLMLVWTLLCCFGPGGALYAFGNHEDPVMLAGTAGMLGLGGLYFPMALLAVGVTDNYLALNPAVVIPSIFRVFWQYLVVCLILILLAGLRVGTELALALVPVPILPSLVAGCVSLYALAVGVHLLGLLYYRNQQRLGWFS